MITLIGYPKIDQTIRRFGEFLNGDDFDFRMVDLGDLISSDRVFCESSDSILRIEYDCQEILLDESASCYQRIFLPSVVNSSRVPLGNRLNMEILSWLAYRVGIVVNRLGAASSNSSKPFHTAELVSCGFRVPDWEVYGVHALARMKVQPDGFWISKGCSAVRSRACVVDREAFSKLGLLEETPSLFQRRIVGEHVRVHFIGMNYIAIGINCSSVDYRYLHEGDRREVRELEVPEHIRLSCLEYLIRENGLFLGFDFIVEQETGIWWLLEANPMPGYDFYDRMVDRKISRALARLLTGETAVPTLPFRGDCGNLSVIEADRLPVV